MPYPVMNTLLDAAYPKGALNYWKSSFTSGLSDARSTSMIERFATRPVADDARSLLEHFHGAVTRVPATATALPHREPGYNLLHPTEWTDPADTTRNIAWTQTPTRRFSRTFPTAAG